MGFKLIGNAVLVFFAFSQIVFAQFASIDNERFVLIAGALIEDQMQSELLAVSELAGSTEWDFHDFALFLPYPSNDRTNVTDMRKFGLWSKLMLRTAWRTRFGELAAEAFPNAEEGLINDVARHLHELASGDAELHVRYLCVVALVSRTRRELEQGLALVLMATTNWQIELDPNAISHPTQQLTKLLSRGEYTSWVAGYTELTFALAVGSDEECEEKLRVAATLDFEDIFRLPLGSKVIDHEINIEVERFDQTSYKTPLEVSTYALLEGIRSAELWTVQSRICTEFYRELCDLLVSRLVHERALYLRSKPYLDILTARAMQIDNRRFVEEYLANYFRLAERLDLSDSLDNQELAEVVQAAQNLRFPPAPVLGSAVFDYFAHLSALRQRAISWERSVLKELETSKVVPMHK